MNEQPKSRLNASDPTPYVIAGAFITLLVVIVIAGWFIITHH